MKGKFTKLIAALALLVFMTPSMAGWGQTRTTTYKLVQVTSVEANGLYVFEQSGHVMNNSTSSSALETTDSYNTTGLIGTETYVWTLETATNGFYMKNVSIGKYLNNTDKGSIKQISNEGSGVSDWTFTFQTNNTVLIKNSNNSNRYLGYQAETTYKYKTYTNSGYPSAIKVYKLVPEGATVAAPSITPADNSTVLLTDDIVMTCSTDGAAIYYNINSNDAPTASSTPYSTAFHLTADNFVNNSCTVKAIAIKESVSSGVTTRTYTWAQVAKPTFSPAAGAIDSGTQVSISCTTEGATIQYSTDGTHYSAYTGPIEITAEATLYAKATATGYNESEVATAHYTINSYCQVSYYTNGIADGTAQVLQGQAIGDLPVATAAYIPAGYTFIGWYNGNLEPTSTAPECIIPTQPVNSDLTLRAVFAMVSGSGSSDTYALVSNVNDLNDGDIIILVSTGSYNANSATHYFTVANGNVNSSDLMNPVDVTISENKVTSTDVAPITLVEVTGGGWKLQMGTQYIVAGDKKITLGNNGSTNTIAISNDIATVSVVDGSAIRKLQYNPNNGNGRFAYYTSTQKAIAIYKQESSVTYSNYRTSYTEDHDLTINGYGAGEGNWYLIASPMYTTPDAVTNMLTEEDHAPYSFDLYRFNQSVNEEWQNYHQHSGDFNLVPGQGYLYANKGDENETPNTVTLTFTGAPYNGNGTVNLTFDEDADGDVKGWNLIGNPFAGTADLPDGLSYYIMNEERTELTAGDATTIGASEAIFVQATATGQSVTFTKQSRNAGSNAILSLNLSSVNKGLIDRAIVRFDEGNALPKFMLNPNNTKVFIPVEGKNYAVVRNEAQGEMPVNFKANENGTYTITVNAENVETNYLHLIDNMTGANVDLLQTPSYSFEAKTTDYESRFRLVFASNNASTSLTDDETFAFFSNGSLIINNEGQAMLQIVDVNGRIISNETVNGSVSKAIDLTPGVYVMRLINGDNVRTQKIIVK